MELLCLQNTQNIINVKDALDYDVEIGICSTTSDGVEKMILIDSMYLSQEHVKQLLPVLTMFANEGRFFNKEEEEERVRKIFEP